MTDNLTAEYIKSATQSWLQTVIIDYGICPFAKREQERGSIYFSVNHDTDIEPCLLNLIAECDRLDTEPDIETTLLIYAKAFADFDDYLDFVEIAETLLSEQGYEGIYQLASFHPDYCFQGADLDDAANYTNRSPYPMLHLLREASIEQAVASHPDPEGIPPHNIELTRKLGLAKMQTLLAACYPATS
ncbi:MAG: DUF1415 domain-containing protein [Methylococcales bacterium]|nr:DUF1415 domain-containing protein [Methylobacter sp.]MDP2428414.1 DUF1415 domain-containing protein [Methylobacter sp.]MDP3055744.1 DUF1415 domain-containing protein [Methylobacter sp.]MDP3360587.1 DUF1415 domain-containing protein [Methylobacter sp.]MDZ4157145.1 DUF1415 domain-containing protein [Methylococcales bacterium]